VTHNHPDDGPPAGGGGGCGGVERTYLKPHSTHVTLLVDHPSHRARVSTAAAAAATAATAPPTGSEEDAAPPRVFAAARHFNLSCSWEAALHLTERLLSPQQGCQQQGYQQQGHAVAGGDGGGGGGGGGSGSFSTAAASGRVQPPLKMFHDSRGLSPPSQQREQRDHRGSPRPHRGGFQERGATGDRRFPRDAEGRDRRRAAEAAQNPRGWRA
jgi:hypothetical protein